MSQGIAIVVGVGAIEGLGARLCERFAREGLHVLAAGRTRARLDELAAKIGAAGGLATAAPTDTTREAEVLRLFESADALVIVSPEYNHGYPGVLKNALDYFYAQYKRMPVALVTVSNGGHGGVNAWAQLVTVFAQLGAIVLPQTIAVSNVDKAFAEDGTPLEAAYVKRTDGMMNELVWLARRLNKAEWRT